MVEFLSDIEFTAPNDKWMLPLVREEFPAYDAMFRIETQRNRTRVSCPRFPICRGSDGTYSATTAKPSRRISRVITCVTTQQLDDLSLGHTAFDFGEIPFLNRLGIAQARIDTGE